MRLIRGIPRSQAFKNGCILTIGNFDGVHLGHKAVIDKLAERGKSLSLPIVILIFEPQPLEYFLRDKAPPRLTRLREKVTQFAKLPVDDLVIVRFNKQLADYDAEQFIDEILVERLNVKHLVIGDDFRFGKARQGDFALLKEKGEVRGFTAEDTGSLLVNDQRISSTLIRNALSKGDLEQAEAMLGHRYSICGRVIHGDKRGRTIGYPTANIGMARKNLPISGVFAVTMTGIDGLEIEGIANIGVRPTVDGSNKVVLETHLFDFDRDIYGNKVTVHFKQKIRAERRFRTVDELKEQIVADVAEAKNIFAAQTIEDNGL
ncbi:MAG: bifunctional riboflavin kinase/FAD synthetase [Methyloglobulus sp.]|nr:bifunctional riboflavin kinase/FAD synthetase [Pseudomonadota bacterium]MSS75779.1 bifunctional riboflavin kinase/FAD synthetase [Methyloglobulus sp.]